LTHKAVILAAGRGTRMRAASAAVDLSPAQRGVAQLGLKAMIPIGSRPFLDYVLSGLADSGIRRVCLVVGPENREIRDYYSGSGRPDHPDRRPVRLALEFVEQVEPRGTADAVLAAEGFAAGDPVLCLNADNLYPRSALEALCGLPRAGLAGFRRSALLRESNFPPDRVGAFALIEVDSEGELVRILEKPDPAQAAGFGEDPLVSMNAWLLPPTMYPACRAVVPSPRGELELQDAIRVAIDRWGERFLVIESHQGVLDLSQAEDIPAVEARLRHVKVRT